MKIRCSSGISVNDYYGGFLKMSSVEVTSPSFDADKTICASLKFDSKIKDSTTASIQFALLYTN
jgi:protein transport protein SEC24